MTSMDALSSALQYLQQPGTLGTLGTLGTELKEHELGQCPMWNRLGTRLGTVRRTTLSPAQLLTAALLAHSRANTQHKPSETKRRSSKGSEQADLFRERTEAEVQEDILPGSLRELHLIISI
jgi:hypothetical protein